MDSGLESSTLNAQTLGTVLLVEVLRLLDLIGGALPVEVQAEQQRLVVCLCAHAGRIRVVAVCHSLRASGSV